MIEKLFRSNVGSSYLETFLTIVEPKKGYDKESCNSDAVAFTGKKKAITVVQGGKNIEGVILRGLVF